MFLPHGSCASCKPSIMMCHGCLNRAGRACVFSSRSAYCRGQSGPSGVGGCRVPSRRRDTEVNRHSSAPRLRYNPHHKPVCGLYHPPLLSTRPVGRSKSPRASDVPPEKHQGAHCLSPRLVSSKRLGSDLCNDSSPRKRAHDALQLRGGSSRTLR